MLGGATMLAAAGGIVAPCVSCWRTAGSLRWMVCPSSSCTRCPPRTQRGGKTRLAVAGLGRRQAPYTRAHTLIHSAGPLLSQCAERWYTLLVPLAGVPRGAALAAHAATPRRHPTRACTATSTATAVHKTCCFLLFGFLGIASPPIRRGRENESNRDFFSCVACFQN